MKTAQVGQTWSCICDRNKKFSHFCCDSHSQRWPDKSD